MKLEVSLGVFVIFHSYYLPKYMSVKKANLTLTCVLYERMVKVTYSKIIE